MRWDIFWDKLKIILWVVWLYGIPAFIIYVNIEYKYAQPNDIHYHYFEDCKNIKDRDNLRRIKSIEIRRENYKECEVCRRRKARIEYEEQEVKEINEGRYYPLR